MLTKADKLPPEALKELLKHVNEIPASVLEDLIKNADQLSPDVIAALLASNDLPASVRDKLMKEINSNKKLKDKLKSSSESDRDSSKKRILLFSIGSVGQRRGRCGESCTQRKTRSEKTKDRMLEGVID